MFIPLYDHNPLRHIRRPYVNYGLIAVSTLVFLMTGSFGEAYLQQAAFSFGLVPSVVNDLKDLPVEYALIPQDFSYFSYFFLHVNLLHLAGNMVFLWVFGDNIEDAVGHFRYLVFYLACGAAGGFVHAFFTQQSDVPLIGASGAVAGIIGAYLMLHPRVRVWVLLFARIPLPINAGIILTLWLVYQVYALATSYFNESEVSWLAHLGGFFTGVLLIVILRRPGVPLFDRNLPAQRI